MPISEDCSCDLKGLFTASKALEEFCSQRHRWLADVRTCGPTQDFKCLPEQPCVSQAPSLPETVHRNTPRWHLVGRKSGYLYKECINVQQ
jgi:hypothetical protein